MFTQWPYLNSALMKAGTGLKGLAAEHAGFSGFTVLWILWQQYCCQVGATSFKSGGTVGALWDLLSIWNSFVV